MSRRTIGLLVALVVAVAVGVGAGYFLWGIPKDWYANRDPAKLPAGEENDLIRYGWNLVVNTAGIIGKSAKDPQLSYAGSNLRCTNCHLNAGLQPFAAPLVSTYTTYPLMANNTVTSLADRINGCMVRSMNGKPLPVDGREMQALLAYMRFLGDGTPQGVRVPGMGLLALKPPPEPPSADRGKQVFAVNCTRCHGADGQGAVSPPPRVGFDVPPLWGDGSFNAGAGMADIRMASAFIHANMPRGVNYLDPVLSEQQAWDVAAFVTTQPRPPAPAK